MHKSWIEQLQDYIDVRLQLGGCVLGIIGFLFVGFFLIKIFIENWIFITICLGAGVLTAAIFMLYIYLRFDKPKTNEKIKAAKKLYNQKRRQLGKEHVETLTCLNNLAVEFSNIKEYKTALNLHKRVYNARCQVLGETHPKTLLSFDNMAVTYARLNDPDQALDLLKKVYDYAAKNDRAADRMVGKIKKMGLEVNRWETTAQMKAKAGQDYIKRSAAAKVGTVALTSVVSAGAFYAQTHLMGLPVGVIYVSNGGSYKMRKE